MDKLLLAFVISFLALPAWADNDSDFFHFGGDSFGAGRSVIHDRQDTDDLFLAGEVVEGQTDISGSAHLAGREVTMDGDVGGDAYVAGEEVVLGGNVLGDATLAGRTVLVTDVGGDLRVAGSKLELNGEVAGYALIAGEEVVFNAIVNGDVGIAAENVEWGQNASIGGVLTIYEEELGELEVPVGIVAEDGIERREIEDWEGPTPPNWRGYVASFLVGVIAVAGIAALIAAVVPERLAEMRRQLLERPFRSLWLGFLTQSAVIGAGVVFAVTIIGLLLTPAMVVLALVGGFAGYVVAAYAFGVGLTLLFGKKEPDSIADRALAAGLGALAAGVIGLIPFIGWLFVLVLVLSGVGAITVRVVRPAFFADGL